MRRCPALAVVAALAATGAALAAPPRTNVVDTKLARFFGPFSGCLVLHDVARNQTLRVNPDKCLQRVSPCSTFKIWHSLVALETGVVADEKTVIPWDGKERSRPALNKDHTLESALRDSAVWFYQEIATRIGPQRMEHFMNEVPYGNRDISGGLTKFWLSDTLEISPDEQLWLLEQLYHGDLPFRPEVEDTVRRIMVQEKGEGTELSGKTGSGQTKDGKALGWFVGRAVGKRGEHLFVVEIEGSKADGRAAREIALDVLSAREIYP